MATECGALGREGRARLLIYPLSLAIYCTSWTFFGSVGSASRTGYEFLDDLYRSDPDDRRCSRR